MRGLHCRHNCHRQIKDTVKREAQLAQSTELAVSDSRRAMLVQQ